MWDKFLSDKMSSEENLILAQEIMGYAISPFHCAEKWFLLYGTGRSGKGTFLAVIESIIGNANVSNVAFQSLGDRFAKSALFAKVANIHADLSSGYTSEKAISTLKSLIGRDTITAEYKGQDLFTFQCTAKMLFACNTLPVNTGDNKHASFWDKLVMLSMDNGDSINVDPHFKTNLCLPENRNSIFLWALDGLRNIIRKNFIFHKNLESTELVMEFSEHSNTSIQFALDCGEFSQGNRITCAELSNAYKTWCSESNRLPKNIKQVIEDINEYYIFSSKKQGYILPQIHDKSYAVRYHRYRHNNSSNAIRCVEGFNLFSDF